MPNFTSDDWGVILQAVIHYRALAAEFDNEAMYAQLVAAEEKILAARRAAINS